MTPQPQKPRVLVVDDHPANRRAFGSLLEQDYTVVLAESGAQALELVLRDEYAVILLDVRMPGMDGFEVADLIRKRGKARYTPIIFLSAYDQTVVQMKRGYLAGAIDFLFSPVDEELLKHKVAAYAQSYLRNEALRLEIAHLQRIVEALRPEGARSSTEESLRNKVLELEGIIEVLKRQVDPAPL